VIRAPSFRESIVEASRWCWDHPLHAGILAQQQTMSSAPAEAQDRRGVWPQEAALTPPQKGRQRQLPVARGQTRHCRQAPEATPARPAPRRSPRGSRHAFEARAVSSAASTVTKRIKATAPRQQYVAAESYERRHAAQGTSRPPSRPPQAHHGRRGYPGGGVTVDGALRRSWPDPK